VLRERSVAGLRAPNVAPLGDLRARSMGDDGSRRGGDDARVQHPPRGSSNDARIANAWAPPGPNEGSCMAAFLGIDHLDVRVRALAQVEAFYDVVMPALGLAHKRYAFVDEAGDWYDRVDRRDANVVEYYEAVVPGEAARFVGFIEDPTHEPGRTRIAFALANSSDLEAWEARLLVIGAVDVERSDDMAGYPALFFDDPAGTKLELCARLPKRPATT
jgi:hypothetical protein